MGRRPTYTDKHRERLLEMLSDGMTLREACRQDDMPSPAMVLKWCSTIPGFGEQYALARHEGYLILAEELLEICDDANNDFMERKGKDGQSEGWVINGEHVQRSKLRLDTRKWLLSKALPKIYGDKVQVDATVKDEREESTTDLAKAAALLLREGIEEQEETRH